MARSLANTVGVVKESKRQQTLATRLKFFFVFLPPLILVLLIFHYGVDVMDWDQWEIARLFERASQGALTFSDVFAQQAEFRQLFPNLIFLGLGALTSWNIKYEMLLIFSLACLVALNLYTLGRVTLRLSDSTLFVIALLSSMLIFSPAQYENWLRGEQVVYLMPAACFTTALRVVYSKLNRTATMVICIVLSTIATFSSSNGIVCWVILVPVLFFPLHKAVARYWLVTWVLVAVLNLSLYLYDYQKPSYSPPLDAALRHPLRTILFFTDMLGAPLLTVPRLGIVVAAFGAAMTVLFMMSWRYVVSLQSEKDRRDLLAWLSVGAYSVATAIMVTIARTGFGADQAFSSRYAGFSVYLAVSLFVLGPAILSRTPTGMRMGESRLLRSKPVVVAVSAVILIHLANSLYGVRQMDGWRTSQLQAKACLLLINVVEGDCLTRGFPAVNVVRDRTNAMNDLGYLRPALIRTNRVLDIAAPATRGDHATGRFSGLDKAIGGVFVASGSARLPRRGDPADAVLLTYETRGGEPLIFALGQVNVPKASLGRSFGERPQEDTYWEDSFSATTLPVERPIRISSWAFDALTGKAYPLDGSYVIPSEVGSR